MSRSATSMASLAAWVGMALLAACSRAAAPPPDAGPEPGLLHAAWYGDNRARLEALLAAHAGAVASAPPVAVFDWDNTIIKNDIGDALFAWMVRQGKILQPPARDWLATSPWLTAAAAVALLQACGDGAPGTPLPSDTRPACAHELMSVYHTQRTGAGAAAFAAATYHHRTVQPSYAWVAQLQAGYTAADIEAMTEAVLDEQLLRPVGATETVGGMVVPAYLRIYEPMAELVAVLASRGFAVWVLSASPQAVVRTFAARIGIDPQRVIGIRNHIAADGALTYELLSCGMAAPVAAVLPYMDGKRCWMNTEIFAEPAAQAATRLEPARRPVLVAGDSDTDVTFMAEATGLRVVLNRHKPELMCRAYHDGDGKWLVNPMFIAPLPQRPEPYPCATTACITASGEGEPCRHQNDIIPDQIDRVY